MLNKLFMDFPARWFISDGGILSFVHSHTHTHTHSLSLSVFNNEPDTVLGNDERSLLTQSL